MKRIAIVGGGRAAALLRRAADALGLDVAGDAAAAGSVELVVLAGEPWLAPTEPVGVPVTPGARSLALAADRLDWLWFLHGLNIPTPAFCPAESARELAASLTRIEPPAVVRTRRRGGAEPRPVTGPVDAYAMWDELGGQGLIVEAVEPGTRVIAQSCVRRASGESEWWAAAERRDLPDGGVLFAAPASHLPRVAPAVAARYATRVLTAAEHVGAALLTMEFGPRGLLVNGFAPGPSPEADWTLTGEMADQYAAHLRAVLDLPVGLSQKAGVRAVLMGGGPALAAGGVAEMRDPARLVEGAAAVRLFRAETAEELDLAFPGA